MVVPVMQPPRWTVSVDALWLERSVGSSVPFGYSIYTAGPLQGYGVDSLYSDDCFFPLEAGLRFQVSRWLNDRADIEASYWGLQQWSEGRTIYGDSG